MTPAAKFASVGAALTVCCLCSVVAAQPTQPSNQPSAVEPNGAVVQPAAKPVAKPATAKPKSLDPADAKALVLYRQGDAAYAAGRYSAAVLKFRAAYELSGRPQLLFNMANALQQMGRYANAAENLNNFVSHAAPSERAAIRSRISFLRQMSAAKRKRDASVARLRLQVRGFEAERDSGARWAFAAWAGSSLALMVGVVFAERSGHAAEDARRDCVGTVGGLVCLRSAEARFDDEKRYATIADVSFSVGLVGVAVGVYLYLRSRGRVERERLTVQPRFGPRAAGMDFGLTF